MKYLFLLALFLSPLSPARAADPALPDLLKLEKDLTSEQRAKAEGSISPEQYESFLGRFRGTLTETVSRAPLVPEESAAHARILVLLGERNEAVAGLNRALEQHPRDSTLRLSLGQTYLEQQDYAAALAEATAVLETDPTNKNALFLKHQSIGRAPANSSGPGAQPAPASAASAEQRVAYTEQGNHRPIVTEVPVVPANEPAPRQKEPIPLLPFAIPLGAGLIGYGVYRNQRATWGANEPLDKPTEVTDEQIAENRKKLKVAAASVAIGFGIVYALPIVIGAVPTAVSFIMRGRGGTSFQHLATSESGAIGPLTQKAVRTAAASLPELTVVESEIVGEAKVILGSPQFTQLRAAFQAGKPASVTIGRRLIQYEPGMPASGITYFEKNGFIMGREAFASETEAHKTILHELHRLYTSASGGGMTADLSSKEALAASQFADKAAKFLKK